MVVYGYADEAVRQVSLEGYRELMTSFPTGIAIVTSADATGAPRGLTTNALMSVSADPPILAISVGSESRTLAAIRETGGFCVNFMGEEAEEVCRLFASKAPDKFQSVMWGRTVSGTPMLLEGAIAVAECTVVDEYEIGDHFVFAALVTSSVAASGFDTPLLYVKREFRRLPPTSACSLAVAG